MRGLKTFLLGVVAAFMVSPVMANASKTEQVGRWRIDLIRTDKGVSCSAASIGKDRDIRFSVSGDGVRVFLSSDKWHLNSKLSYKVFFAVDNRSSHDADGVVVGSSILTFMPSNSSEFVSEISSGTLLRVNFSPIEYAYSLKDAGRAIKAAQSCLSRAN